MTVRSVRMAWNNFLRKAILYRKSSIFALVCFLALSLHFFSKQQQQLYVPLRPVEKRPAPKAEPLQIDFTCKRPTDTVHDPNLNFFNSRTLRSNTDSPRVLFLTESHSTKLRQDITFILDSMRIKFDLQSVHSSSIESLSLLDKDQDQPPYVLILFDNLYRYINLQQRLRKMLDRYCSDFQVGQMAFMPSRKDQNFDRAKIKGSSMFFRQNLKPVHFTLSAEPDHFFHMLKPGPLRFDFEDQNQIEEWVGFEATQSDGFKSLLDMTVLHIATNKAKHPLTHLRKYSACLLDQGKKDGVSRLWFGNSLSQFWLLKMLFADGVRYLSRGKLSLPLTRYVQIDIDDVFVGDRGKKMTVDDVKALIQTQQRLRNLIPGFTFNLGFSGKFFGRGGPSEQEGDSLLAGQHSTLWWFSHSWAHNQAHTRNVSDIVDDLLRNKAFAEDKKLPVDWAYSVAPHHSGVYPVHQSLYNAWRSVWNITVTSTEEYPHLRPASRRRGFVYNGIRVLPRQTCGLYTHTVSIDSYPGGKIKLDESIQGGELFYTIVFNLFLIFMTHQPNYAHSRLALYTFETVFSFIKCYTNLVLKSVPPPLLADKYFRRYPDEVDPLWGNPCHDKRHLDIWSSGKLCDYLPLPKLIILGPQKTGTAALCKFLQLHPSTATNILQTDTFEELQFFSGPNYYNGLDWYLNQFPNNNASGNKLVFEKSATYFTSSFSTIRVHTLIPDTKLIVILTDPALRAYSWFQHMRSKNDSIALKMGFLDLLQANEDNSNDKSVLALKKHCLNPGHYVKYLNKWMELFPSKQLLIVDGEKFRLDPVTIMNSVQLFLDLEPKVDYKDLLRFSPGKGFYCAKTTENKTKCLGTSKGRKYDPMREQERLWLSDHFKASNEALRKLLMDLGYALPLWLTKELEN